MKNNIKYFLITLVIFTTLKSYSQVFYYSDGKKILLETDTTKLFINLNKTKIDQLFLNNVGKIEGVQSVDTTSDRDVMSIKLSKHSSKKKILSTLKKENKVLHVWEAINLKGSPFLPTGEILLKPKAGVTINDILSILNLKNKVTLSAKENYDIVVLNIIDSNLLFNVANLIYESKLVDWCHPNFYVSIKTLTNDPLWPQQYYLRNTGQLGGIAGIDINVEGAWNITQGNANIRIAVIDEGVENHEDLVGRVLNGFTPRDVNGNGRPTITGAHGEATAGIIAATKDNAIGISGVAPLCQIVPVNIFAGGETALDIANGINWAWNQGQAAVLSNSWKSSASSDAIIQSITNARTQGRNGLGSIVVFASGNDGNIDVAFPGNVNGVITVGSCNNAAPAGQIWYYSQRGPSMDLVAPSGDINLMGDLVTLDRMGSSGYEAGNYTNRFGGTSAACPQISGVAALMLSANANLTETQVRTTLQNTATDMGTVGFDNTFGFGRANACAAVRAALSLAINGDNTVCTVSNNYTIPRLPAGATVTWSVSPAGIATVNSPYSPQTTLTKNGNGYITLTAAITTACGNLTLIRQVAVGTPPISNIVLQRAGVSCYYDLAVNAPPAGTTIEFSEDNVNWSTGTNIGGYYKADLLLLGPGYQREYARTRNSCGIGPVYSRNVPIPPPPANCQYRPITKNNSKSDEKLLNISTLRVYPNPVNKKLLIEVPSINNTWVNIYNNEGKLMHNARLSNTKSSLNISSYRPGLYLIKVMVNGQVKTMKIIKE